MLLDIGIKASFISATSLQSVLCRVKSAHFIEDQTIGRRRRRALFAGDG
jgi:hypothetical protein